jgi:hypothetical protein
MKVQNALLQFLQSYDPTTKTGQVFQDMSAGFTITNAANNGSGLIRITAAGHGLKTGYNVYIVSVNGVTAANSTASNPSWQVRVIDQSNFDLVGSTFGGTWASSPNAKGYGALVGTVHGDKLTMQMQLQAYNNARIAFLEGVRARTPNLNEQCSRLGAQVVTTPMSWTRTGLLTMADVPPGQLQFIGIISYTATNIVKLSNTMLQNVLAGTRYHLQSASRAFVFQEGAYFVHHGDYVSYASQNVGSASNASPIVLTVTSHGYATGDWVYVKDVLGNTAANGQFQIEKVDDNSFKLLGSTGNGAYTSGGTVRRLYLLQYLGITDWTLADVYGGTVEETIEPNDIPTVIQLAIKYAQGIGGADLNALAANLIGGKQ